LHSLGAQQYLHLEGRGDNSNPKELEHQPTSERDVLSKASRKRRFFLPADQRLRDRPYAPAVTQSASWIY
jgi:hypothetical protein